MSESRTPRMKALLKLISLLSKEQIQLMNTIREDNKPKRAEVSSEEREKIEKILAVFQEYIDQHYYFDIVYSKKFGYCRPDMEGSNQQYNTADDMMKGLIGEFYLDVRELQLGGQHKNAELRPQEEFELRKRITPYIAQLEDARHYFDLLDKYIREI